MKKRDWLALVDNQPTKRVQKRDDAAAWRKNKESVLQAIFEHLLTMRNSPLGPTNAAATRAGLEWLERVSFQLPNATFGPCLSDNEFRSDLIQQLKTELGETRMRVSHRLFTQEKSPSSSLVWVIEFSAAPARPFQFRCVFLDAARDWGGFNCARMKTVDNVVADGDSFCANYHGDEEWDQLDPAEIEQLLCSTTLVHLESLNLSHQRLVDDRFVERLCQNPTFARVYRLNLSYTRISAKSLQMLLDSPIIGSDMPPEKTYEFKEKKSCVHVFIYGCNISRAEAAPFDNLASYLNLGSSRSFKSPFRLTFGSHKNQVPQICEDGVKYLSASGIEE